MTPTTSRLYTGHPGNTRVSVEEPDGSVRDLEHHVLHSPDGFSWGYHGSGPAELARCILWDHTGHEPSPAVYQAFKSDVIAGVPQRNVFELTSDMIEAWIEVYQAIDGVEVARG